MTQDYKKSFLIIFSCLFLVWGITVPQCSGEDVYIPNTNYAQTGDSFFCPGESGYAALEDFNVQDLDYSKNFSFEALINIKEHTLGGAWGGIITKTYKRGGYNPTSPGFALSLYSKMDKHTQDLYVKVGDGINQASMVFGNYKGYAGPHYVTVTWDAATKTLTAYVDGLEESQRRNTNIIPENIKNGYSLQIGNGLNTYKRNINMVRLWNRLLTQEEITQLWNDYDATKVHALPSGFDRSELISEWLMHELLDPPGNEGATLLKDTAGGNHLQLMGDARLILADEPLIQVYPKNGAQNVAKSVTLIAKGGAEIPSHVKPLSYSFEIDSSVAFDSNDLKQSGWIAHFAEWKPILKPDTTYYWRVKAKDASGQETPFTDSWQLTTKSVSTWYVRPLDEDAKYGDEDGMSYDNAWNGLGQLVWGPQGIEAGDTLYVCGTHIKTLFNKNEYSLRPVDIKESGYSLEHPITIRMDYPEDKGIVWSNFIDSYTQNGHVGNLWTAEGNGVYSTKDLKYRSNGLLQDIQDKDAILLKRRTPETWAAEFGSWYSDEDTVYLKTTDGLDPTGRIYESGLGYKFSLGRASYIKFLKCNMFGNHHFVSRDGYYAAAPKAPSHHIVFDGCELKYAGGDILFIFLENHDWTIRNCELSYGANGIYTVAQRREQAPYSANRLTVENCYIHDIGDTGHGNYRDSDSHAIGIQGGNDHLIQNNYIERAGSCILYWANIGQEQKNGVYRNNFIKDNYLQQSYGGVGMGASGNNWAKAGLRTGNKFYNNIIIGAKGRSLSFQLIDEHLVFNNLIYKSGPEYEGLKEDYNCLIYGEPHYIESSGLFAFSRVESHLTGCNNMFVHPQHKNFLVNYGSGANASLNWDYNLYYPETPAEESYQNKAMYHLSEGYNSITSWITNTPYDNYAVTQEPLFENSSGTMSEPEDFYPAWNSCVIDAGVDFDDVIDFSGNPVYGVRDIGPYEYQPPFIMGADKISGDSIRMYADGKYRILKKTSQPAVDLSVSPAIGWPGFDKKDARPTWMDVYIINWDTAEYKKWMEHARQTESTRHVVGDLAALAQYQLKVNGVDHSTLTSDRNGKVSFEYMNTPDVVEFELVFLNTDIRRREIRRSWLRRSN